MVARHLDNCLCGSFFHSLFGVYVCFFQCLIFFRVQIQPPAYWYKDRATSKCRMAITALGWILYLCTLWTLKRVLHFPFVGGRGRQKRNPLGKEFLPTCYSLHFIRVIWWLLTLLHPLPSNLLCLDPNFVSLCSTSPCHWWPSLVLLFQIHLFLLRHTSSVCPIPSKAEAIGG